MSDFNIAESTGVGSLSEGGETDFNILSQLLLNSLEQSIQLPDWANPRELLGPDKLGRERTIMDLFVSPEGKIAPLDLAFGMGTGLKMGAKTAKKGLTHLIRKYINPKFNTVPVYRGTNKLPEFTMPEGETAVMKTTTPVTEMDATYSSLNPYKALSYARPKGYMHTFDVPIEKLPHNIPGGGVAETQVFKKGIPIEYSRNILQAKDFGKLIEQRDMGKSVGQLSDEITTLLHSLQSNRRFSEIQEGLLGSYIGTKLGQEYRNISDD